MVGEKTCKVCRLEKPYDPKAKKNSKASGFMGKVCWDCRNVADAARSRQTRSTEEGLAKANAARAKSMMKYLAIPENRAKVNAASVKRCLKRLKTDAWYQLRMKLAQATRQLVHALVNGTSNRDGRFLRLFGHSRAEVLAHITSQCHAKRLLLNDYQVTWQLDHKEPVALATDSNQLEAMFKLANCQVLTMEEHAIKTIVDNARVRSLEASR